MMSDDQLNPCAYLAKVLRIQLRFEETMPVAHRVKTMWTAMVEFAGTRIIIGRGGANTCFYTFGSGKRKIDYPTKLLKLLDAYARQAYPLYQIIDSDEIIKTTFSESNAKGTQPERGWTLQGVDVDSNKTILCIARQNVRGKLDWIARSK
jgi:hypothetical protein